VAAAARELGFAPNVLARGLLAGRTYTVGVITTDSFGRFSIPVMLGAEDALGADQISVFMCDTRDDPDRERQYLNMLLSRQVDGLIVAGRRIEPRPSIGLGLGIPVVHAMTQSMDSDEPAILPDDTGGGRLAAEHLLSLGRRRFGHIAGPERFLCARKRARGFCDAAPRPTPTSPRTTCCTASGASGGAGRRSGWCWAVPRTSTRSSAAATRSPAASPTRCG
jgi:LacI family transcriptional regulator